MLNCPVFKDYNLSIKKGSAKVSATPSTVTLYARDRFSQATIDLKATDSKLTAIKEVAISETAKSPSPFHLFSVGGNTYAIGFKNNELPKGFKAGQTKTVKLNVFFEGNLTGKPDATVSVKVQIK